MPKPMNHPKPDLSGFTNRVVDTAGSRNAVEAALYSWCCDIVKKTKQPPADDGMKAEMFLMSTAKESIDVLMQAAPIARGMTLRGGNRQKIHADFHWLRRNDGSWVVNQVCFALSANDAANELARKRALRDSLQQQAESRAEARVDMRKLCFPIEKLPLANFPQNVDFGSWLVHDAIDRAYGQAKEVAEMLKNPITQWDMLQDVAGLPLRAAKGLQMTKFNAARLEETAADLGMAEKVSKTTERLENAKEALEIGKSERDDVGVYLEKEKSRGDKLLEIGLDVASMAADCPFMKTIAGMMFDVAISSDASRVAKARSRCYVYFVAGYINQLTLSDTGAPKKKVDKKFFDFGVQIAPKLGSPAHVRVQLALINYAANHYVQGGWKGLSFRAKNWNYPDQYAINWNPILLGQALTTQLHTQQYLIG
jgi:hypothetical protein